MYLIDMYKIRIISVILALTGTASNILWAQQAGVSEGTANGGTFTPLAEDQVPKPTLESQARQDTGQAANLALSALAPDEAALIELLDRVSQLILTNRRLAESFSDAQANQRLLEKRIEQQTALLSMLCSFEPSEGELLPMVDACQSVLQSSKDQSDNTSAELKALLKRTTELETKLAELAQLQGRPPSVGTDTPLPPNTPDSRVNTVPIPPPPKFAPVPTEPFVFARLDDGNPDWQRAKDIERLKGIVAEAQCLEAGKWLQETVQDVYEYIFFVMGRNGSVKRCVLSRGTWAPLNAAATDSAHVLTIGASK
mmetsp:Transcript_22853/g.38170  ORF Transcript_22853/g.38170 Transcript_22853/m.38170 type:complete len:312 (+) Transcript_22853:7515-8450(+)